MKKRKSKTFPKDEIAPTEGALFYDIDAHSEEAEAEAAQRPKTRGDCKHGLRPCPWVSCKYHLYLDVTWTGNIIFNFMEDDGETLIPPWKIYPSCALDIADKGSHTLEELGSVLALTRERIRQIEDKSERRLKKNDSLQEWRGYKGTKIIGPGTNFYWKASKKLPTGEARRAESLEDPIIHIGKRRKAGLYCLDCMRTFCKTGEPEIYTEGAEWAKSCPSCGAEPCYGGTDSENTKYNKSLKEEVCGVVRVFSFSWVQNKNKVIGICKRNRDKVVVIDEYDDRYTGKQFLDMLSACPIQYYKTVGEWFS